MVKPGHGIRVPDPSGFIDTSSRHWIGFMKGQWLRHSSFPPGGFLFSFPPVSANVRLTSRPTKGSNHRFSRRLAAVASVRAWDCLGVWLPVWRRRRRAGGPLDERRLLIEPRAERRSAIYTSDLNVKNDNCFLPDFIAAHSFTDGGERKDPGLSLAFCSGQKGWIN